MIEISAKENINMNLWLEKIEIAHLKIYGVSDNKYVKAGLTGLSDDINFVVSRCYKYLWLYIVSPIIGAMCASICYKYLKSFDDISEKYPIDTVRQS